MSFQDEQSEVSESTEDCLPLFDENHGKNVVVTNNGLTAERITSYNDGIVIMQKPLRRNRLIQVSSVNLLLVLYFVFDCFSDCMSEINH